MNLPKHFPPCGALAAALVGLATLTCTFADGKFAASITAVADASFDIAWPTAAGCVDTVQVSEDLLGWRAVPGSSTRGLDSARRVSVTLPRPHDPRTFFRVLRIADPGVSITEFMAVNDLTIPDPTGTGNAPDWIELYNGGGEPLSLDGYFLTDSQNDLTRWRFPDVTLEPGGFLVVHATGSDQRDPNLGTLETDFQLGRSGAYLALVAPAGDAILSEIGGGEFGYPEQFEDVSFGVPFVTIPPGGGVEIPAHVVAQWNMDEPSGPLTDAAGGGSGAHSVSLTDMSYLQPALVADGGSAIGFSATVGTPSTTNAGDLGVASNGQFTAEGFFQISDAEAGSGLNFIIGSRRISTGWAIWLRDGGKLGFVFDGTGGLTGTEFFGKTTVDDGEIHHFALVVDGGGGSNPGTGIATLYLDGAVDHVMDNIAANHMDADDGFYIGRRHNSPFGGSLDVLRFSDTALAPDELLKASDFTGGTGAPTGQPRGLAGFMRDPTPGLPNAPTSENTGPWIRDVAHTPDHGSAGEDIVVTAVIASRGEPVDSVTLTYRTMYEASQPTVQMADDGSGADAAAGDGTFTASIPSATFSAGDMVRWFVHATDTGGNTSRKPEFLRPLESAEYFGTVMQNPDLPATALPVLDWFVPDPTWYRNGSTNNRNYSRASLYHRGEFIDNLRMRTRGRSAANSIKPNFKFDFYNGGHFRALPGAGRVEEMNLNGFHGENIWSRSFMRSVLTYRMLRENGVPTPYSFHVHVRRNGEFFGLCAMEEQVDADFLVRHELNADGALYKASGNGNLLKMIPEGDWSKDLPEDGDFSDLMAFIDGIRPSRPLAERETYVFDNVTIPVMINYLATFAVTLNHDRIQHNYYMYRDSGRSDEWMMIPWDVDRSFSEGAQLTDPSNTNIYYGDSDHWRVSSNSDVYNRLYDALFDIPRTRQMYQRRLRTLVDEWHGDSSTKLKATLADLSAQVAPDAALDEAKWANNRLVGGNNGITNTLNTRRSQLARVTDIPPSGAITNEMILLDVAAAASYHVATFDEGSSWRAPEFDDGTWERANTGFGFDSSSNPSTSFAHHFGHDAATADAIRAAMESASNPSLYIRVPFVVDSTDGIAGLTLNLRFDDGFVAWLNGFQVASANAPANVAWNSGAAGSADEVPARGGGIDFNISAHSGSLVVGENMLAIQLLNRGVSSGDLLCLPTLGAAVVGSQVGAIAFGQIEHNPASGDQDEEFIEIVNTTGSSIDISGWQLRGGVAHRLTAGTVLLGGESLYITPRLQAFRARASAPSGGQGHFVQGNYSGHLSNFGEVVELVGASGSVVASVTTPFDPSPTQQFLRITELMFNPPAPTPAELAAGFSDNDEFEFIELANIGAAPLSLDAVAFTSGIVYSFPAGLTLGPAERIIVARNLAAFQQRYGTRRNTAPNEYRDPADGSNNLQNGGETVKLDDPDASTILDFRYDDRASEGWYDEADGNGSSLEIIDPAGDVDQWATPEAWRPSATEGGSPGA